MTEIEEALINNIILNENAYFFKNADEIELSKKRIEQLLRQVANSSGRQGNYLLRVTNEIIEIDNRNVPFSICIFKYTTKPAFIESYQEGWEETKLAYLVIVNLQNYIVISKKNISGIKEFTDLFIPLDYKMLSTLFVDNDTTFEKFALKNMNISDKAIRGKSLEAINLQENFSPLGANNYILNNIRLNNNNEKVSLSLNTGRINKFGRKNSIESFISWSINLISKIEMHQEHDTFLSIFAEPLDYENEKDLLVPIAVLFLFSKLYDSFEENRISTCKFISNGREKVFSIVDYLHKIERLCQIKQRIKGEKISYYVNNSLTNDLEVKLNLKSITFKSEKLSRVILVWDNDYEQSIIEYINQSNQFIMNFDNIDLIYTNRKLFKDSRLLGNIEHFLKIFKPYKRLSSVISEKGSFTENSKVFSANSIFEFVESEFLNHADYFICDDLEKEWADHIGITNNKIAFYLAKYDTSQYSASSFQDIIGQAQKNLGNMSPVDYQINSKLEFWKKNYKSNLRNNNIQTNITRLRKGISVEHAVRQFKLTKLEPNVKREMYLVINFISKSGLQAKLEQLKNAEAFVERNEIIQILWFISSLISSCREVGVDVYICCRE